MTDVSIPPTLLSVLWTVDITKLDRDRAYIIHQILSRGRIEHLEWLFKVYPKEEIATEFRLPYKAYWLFRFHFVKNVLLHETMPLNEANYVENIPRDLRQ